MVDKNGIEMTCSNCQHRSNSCFRCNFSVGFVASRKALEQHICKLNSKIYELQNKLENPTTEETEEK